MRHSWPCWDLIIETEINFRIWICRVRMPQKFKLEMQLQRDHVEIVEGEEHKLELKWYWFPGLR